MSAESTPVCWSMEDCARIEADGSSVAKETEARFYGDFADQARIRARLIVGETARSIRHCLSVTTDGTLGEHLRAINNMHRSAV